MRVTLKIDSATADEARALVVAWQRSVPRDDAGTDAPTVTMMGIGWGITCPPIDVVRANVIMRDFMANVD